MLNKLIYSQNEKATVCAGIFCVTVYDDAAQVVKGIVLILIVLAALDFFAKTFK